MRGTCEETKPGKWRLRVFVGRDRAGHVKHLNRTVTGTRRQAQSELAKMVAEVERGALVASHPGTVSDLVDRWLEAIALERTPYTVKEYRRLADKTIKPAVGAVRVDRLTGREIDAFYGALTEKGLSAASVRRHHALLHAAFGRAVKWGLVTSNPVGCATPPRVKRPEASAPAVTDVQKLISTAQQEGDSVLATAIALGAVTGARRGELCALRWSDVDPERRLLRVARSLTVIEAKVTEGPTKAHAQRFLAIDDILGALLNKRRRDQEAYAGQAGTDLVPDAFILSRRADGSTPCKPDGLSSAYSRVTRALGLPGHFHELRHFAATVAVRPGRAGVPVALPVYGHAFDLRDRELAGLLGQTVLGAQRPHEARRRDDPAPTTLKSTG